MLRTPVQIRPFFLDKIDSSTQNCVGFFHDERKMSHVENEYRTYPFQLFPPCLFSLSHQFDTMRQRSQDTGRGRLERERFAFEIDGVRAVLLEYRTWRRELEEQSGERNTNETMVIDESSS